MGADGDSAFTHLYVLLFILTLGGNASVLAVLVSTLAHSRFQRFTKRAAGNKPLGQQRPPARFQPSLIFLVLLRVHLTTAPPATVCRLYRGLFAFHGLLSPLLLLLLALDRYYAVCRPHDLFLTRKTAVFSLLTAVLTISLGLVLPSFYDTDPGRAPNATSNNTDTSPCAFYFPSLFLLHFCVAFLLPALLLAAIFFLVHRRLSAHWSAFSTQAPLRRIYRTSLLLVTSHFMCWGPFWIGSAWQFDNPTHSLDDRFRQDYVSLWSEYPRSSSDHAIIFLALLRSGFTWILYYYLNRQVRDSPARLDSLPAPLLKAIYRGLSSIKTNSNLATSAYELEVTGGRPEAHERHSWVAPMDYRITDQAVNDLLDENENHNSFIVHYDRRAKRVEEQTPLMPWGRPLSAVLRRQSASVPGRLSEAPRDDHFVDFLAAQISEDVPMVRTLSVVL